MATSTFVQILAASVGVMGSLFFAIGVMRQSVSAMADLSGTYFDWNPNMVRALAAQKADYLFGGGIIVLAFTLQLVSFLVPTTSKFGFSNPTAVPWVVAGATVVVFFLLRLLAGHLARKYESKINARLKEEVDKQQRELEERTRAQSDRA